MSADASEKARRHPPAGLPILGGPASPRYQDGRESCFRPTRGSQLNDVAVGARGSGSGSGVRQIAPRGAPWHRALSQERVTSVPVPPASPDPPPERSGLERLTPRELEVLHLVARGMTDREIGLALGISTRTVESHVAHVMQRLGVRGRSAAVEVFERHRPG